MSYQVNPSAIIEDTVVIGVFSDAMPELLSANQQQSMADIIKLSQFDAKVGKSLIQYQIPGFAAKRVILLGLGKKVDYSIAMMRKALGALGKAILSLEIKKLFIVLPTQLQHGETHLLRQAIIALEDANVMRMPFKQYKEPQYWPAEITFVMDGQHDVALQQGIAIAEGIKLTKYLGDLPANHCTPLFLAQKATELAKTYSTIHVDIYDEKQMRDLNMGCLLAVAQGSVEPPRLIVMQYQGGQSDTAPIALVGKGVTFDSGGVWLKPTARLDEMKYDMCGAATVFGAIQACAALKLPINVVGIVAATENMLSGSAVKPADVVTSMSGQTVEIINTDAEGRLILCDALTFAGRFKPQKVINIATLTGAIITTLGAEASGVMGNNQPLINELLNAGEASGDRAWQLPLWDEYQELLDTPFADMANISSSDAAKSILAGCFLARFTKDYHWAHLDIAGTAWRGPGNKNRAALGRPMPLLMHFLLEQAKV